MVTITITTAHENEFKNGPAMLCAYRFDYDTSFPNMCKKLISFCFVCHAEMRCTALCEEMDSVTDKGSKKIPTDHLFESSYIITSHTSCVEKAEYAYSSLEEIEIMHLNEIVDWVTDVSDSPTLNMISDRNGGLIHAPDEGLHMTAMIDALQNDDSN